MAAITEKLKDIVRFVVLLGVDFLAISKSSKVNKNTLLLIKVDAIGDYILFRNYIEVLKKSEKYGNYKITLCGNIAYKNLAETFDKEFVDEFIWINPRKLACNIFYRYGILRAISKRGFGVAIQPTVSRIYFAGDSIVKASNAEERIGNRGDFFNIKPWQKRLTDRWYTHLVPFSAEPMMELCRNAEFFRHLGLSSSIAGLPVIKVADDIKRDIKEDEYYILCPGAGLVNRCWPLECFAQLAEKIYAVTGWLGVICGGKEEEELGQKLACLTSAPLRNIGGKTCLSDLVNIIDKARLLVANETGSVHIAAAVGTPAVCVLGGGHYGRFVPYQVAETTSRCLPVAVTNKMPCFNCNWQCKYETNGDTPFPCIKNISVEDVWIQTHILIEQISRKQDSKKANG